MGYLLQQSRGVPGMVMGVVIFLIGLGGLAMIIWGLSWSGGGPKDSSAYYLMMFLGIMIVPLCLVLGVLAFVGGFRKSYPKRAGGRGPALALPAGRIPNKGLIPRPR